MMLSDVLASYIIEYELGLTDTRIFITFTVPALKVDMTGPIIELKPLDWENRNRYVIFLTFTSEAIYFTKVHILK